jgi:RNA polymerase sigma-B factor
LDSVAERGADPHADTPERLALGSALRSLHPRERRLLHLRFDEDLSQSQIAARTGLSQVHVSRMLRAALRRLHDQLAMNPTSG